MSCVRCMNEFTQENYLSCNGCAGQYHHVCLNITTDRFMALTVKHREEWICPECAAITRRTRPNLNTPVRHTQTSFVDESMDTSCELTGSSESNVPNHVPTSNFISMAKFNELLHSLHAWRIDMNSNMAKISDDIKGTLSEIQTEIKVIRTEQTTMKEEICNLNSDIKALQDSVEFQANAHCSLKARVDEIPRASSETAAAAVASLEAKIDSLEQQARQCNVEICNLPERRNENLVGILEATGSAIGLKFSPRDIISVHRVPHAQQGRDRPKNIIVKFSTRIQRDNMLSAFRKIKTLTSSQLGIPGTSSMIYMNEHLTLNRKHLFRKCREVAKELRYKYVWVRNSTILVRENDDCPAIAIRSERDLERLRPCARNIPS